MSDTFQGPGYWMASDGKWYPPERHPDPAYRAQFQPAPAGVAEPSLEPEERAQAVVEVDEGDTVETAHSSIDLIPPAIPTFADESPEEVSIVTPDVSEQVEIEEPTAEEPDELNEVVGFPSVGLRSDDREQDSPHSATSLSDIHNVRLVADEPVETQDGDSPASNVEAGGDDVAIQNESAARHNEPALSGFEAAGTTAPGIKQFSVGSTNLSKAVERPVFETTPPQSVSGAPTAPEVSGIELELGKSIPVRRTPGHAVGSPPQISASTALAVIPNASHNPPPVSLIDRLLAATIFCAGVAMIVGTFLDWSTGTLIQTGWERGDGIATIIAGVVGSATAGSMYVGFHHILPKSIAVICGLVGLVVIGLTAISVLGDNASAGTSIGVGFIVVLAGAAAMTLSGLAHRVDLRY